MEEEDMEDGGDVEEVDAFSPVSATDDPKETGDIIETGNEQRTHSTEHDGGKQPHSLEPSPEFDTSPTHLTRSSLQSQVESDHVQEQ